MKKFILGCVLALMACGLGMAASADDNDRPATTRGEARTACCCGQCQCADCTCQTDCLDCRDCRKHEACRVCDECSHRGTCRDYQAHCRDRHHEGDYCCYESGECRHADDEACCLDHRRHHRRDHRHGCCGR